MKKTYLIIAILLILTLTFAIVIFIASLNTNRSIEKTVTVSPTPINTIPANTNDVVPNTILKGETEKSQIPSIIAVLIEHLPYKGNYFYLTYNFANDSFYVTINKNNQTKGSIELYNFLKQNGILDKNWLGDLNTTYQ